jgi:hypothetical protein
VAPHRRADEPNDLFSYQKEIQFEGEAALDGRPFEPEGELGTDPDGLASFSDQAVRHVTVADDRETPIVEGDQLGKDLSA